MFISQAPDVIIIIRYLWFKILSTNNLTTGYLCTTVKFAKISLTLKFSITCTNALKYIWNGFYEKLHTAFQKRKLAAESLKPLYLAKTVTQNLS